MSLAIRAVPCLGVNNGRIVRGVNFENLRDADDPVGLTRRYGEEGADELTFLDVTASKDGRDTMLNVVRRTAGEVFIPLTVDGGVCNVEDANQLLRTEANKVSVNTVAIARPELLSEPSRHFGVQCIVLSVDTCRVPEGGTSQPSGFEMTTHGSSRSARIDAVEWTRHDEELGVSEILLNSTDGDGTKDGFDLELLEKVRTAVDVPVIASGGAGKAEHFPPAVHAGANAMLTASIFYFDEANIVEVKEEMVHEGIEVCQ